jgi:hypothetical protein
MTNTTPAIYGNAPKNVGQMDFDTSEMMFWLYCPIKLPGMCFERLPPNLEKFAALTEKVFDDVYDSYGPEHWCNSYVYLSAKTIYVSEAAPGNRLGWHSDGFLTNDINYIWADMNPTLFLPLPELVAFSADHNAALDEMERLAVDNWWNQCSYPEKSLLRLDQTVLHAVNPCAQAGLRTFLKVSISDKPYALKGNSINHALKHPTPDEVRQAERNCPQGMM